METKEGRIGRVALSYYSRTDVQKAILSFCQGRETIPSYGSRKFGKRPDKLEYPSEVLNLARNGATSFHCSEELWKDPLEISTELSSDELNGLRVGWDLIIDIDSKYFDYAKKAAVSMIKSLEYHKVKNFGVKFSGSKGFHIIVPWNSFPKQANGFETKDMFPEWPRIILEYIKEEIARTLLENQISNDESLSKDIAKLAKGIRCEKCGGMADESLQITLKCPNTRCKREEKFTKDAEAKYRKRKCPECSTVLDEYSKIKVYNCTKCGLNSTSNPGSFSSSPMYDIYEALGLDVVLVSSRHLFRAPYSLHEKTSLASVVISKDEIDNFNHKDADPLRVSVKDFMPKSTPDEAKELLIQALDWYKTSKSTVPNVSQESSGLISKSRDVKGFKEVKISKESLKNPPSIDKILAGLVDGRKRALFILLNYFRSLNFSESEINEVIYSWNEKNKKPLKLGYVKAQIIWHMRQKNKVLPPNYDKPHYKEIGIKPTEDELRYKNPVNYAIKTFFDNKKTKKSDNQRRRK